MQINDFGPIYKETHPGEFPVELWSTLSNLVFLFAVLYWGKKVYADYKNHRFLAYTLPILLIGFIGGTIYHATRSSNIWLFMDFLPIAILIIAAGVYFWKKLIKNWIPIILIVLLPSILIRGALTFIINNESLQITIGYFVLAITLILPIIIYLIKTKNKRWPLFAGSLASFVIALFFRYADSSTLLPMGTHWLWHLFGGIATFLIIGFIYYDKVDSLKHHKSYKHTKHT